MTDLLVLFALVVALGAGALPIMAGAIIATVPLEPARSGSRSRLGGIGLAGIGLVVFIGAACALLEQLRP